MVDEGGGNKGEDNDLGFRSDGGTGTSFQEHPRVELRSLPRGIQLRLRNRYSFKYIIKLSFDLFSKIVDEGGGDGDKYDDLGFHSNGGIGIRSRAS
ncbi:hypothetical protein SDJN03_12024, partial [Cucurbita argyrosperma subsp. sororia]